jgi:hypothetical protein
VLGLGNLADKGGKQRGPSGSRNIHSDNLYKTIMIFHIRQGFRATTIAKLSSHDRTFMLEVTMSMAGNLMIATDVDPLPTPRAQ